jgi:outer membrane protein
MRATPRPRFARRCWIRRSAILAQARYNLGLSSIVELTQAQLNKTRNEIEQATARYEYQARIAALKYQTGGLRN